MPPRSKTPQPPATPTADPLADLRPPADAPTDREAERAAGGEPELAPTAVYDAAWHADANAQVVAAFHQDTVATGALHKGGTCACRYLARLALTAALGLPVEREEPADEEPAEEEPGRDG